MIQQPKILIVDDTPTNVKLLVELLGSQGYTVVATDSGPEALSLVEKDPPDLVLVDVVMPGMDGFELCRELRTRPQTALLPIVMVTAMYPSDARVRGIEAGADDFLTQPVNKAELLARVRSLLRIKMLHDAIEAHAGELQDWNQKLEVRLAQEAKLAEVARSLGDVSHEIKNLLMPIVTGAGLLRGELEDLFDRLPESDRTRAQTSHKLCEEIIGMLTNAAQRIHVEVKEIADCVKGLSSPLHCTPCRLTEVVESVFKTLHLSASQRRISLRMENLDSLPSIRADQRRLFNAFYNLVHNAIPEVPAGGSITVRGQAEPDAQALLVSVADTGRGIPPDVCRSLFTGDAVGRKLGGTGLGTKIVKDVVDAHGGQITVESQEGVGTTFHLRLPIEPVQSGPMAV